MHLGVGGLRLRPGRSQLQAGEKGGGGEHQRRHEDRRGAAPQRSLTHGASRHQQIPVFTVARAWNGLDATVTFVACASDQRMPARLITR
jgi:hypothetical protein